MDKYQKNKYANEDFFQIIGKISVVFATMDFFVTQLLFRLMSADCLDNLEIKDSATLGCKLHKLNKIKNEDVDYPAVLAEIKKFLPKAITIAEERNRYIHDQWLFNERMVKKGEIGRIRLKRKNELNINCTDMEDGETLKIKDLEKFCDKVIRIGEVIGRIIKSIPAMNTRNVKKEP